MTGLTVKMLKEAIQILVKGYEEPKFFQFPLTQEQKEERDRQQKLINKFLGE